MAINVSDLPDLGPVDDEQLGDVFQGINSLLAGPAARAGAAFAGLIATNAAMTDAAKIGQSLAINPIITSFARSDVIGPAFSKLAVSGALSMLADRQRELIEGMMPKVDFSALSRAALAPRVSGLGSEPRAAAVEQLDELAAEHGLTRSQLVVLLYVYAVIFVTSMISAMQIAGGARPVEVLPVQAQQLLLGLVPGAIAVCQDKRQP